MTGRPRAQVRGARVGFGRGTALGLVLVLAHGGAAHWVAPETIVAALNAEQARAKTGVVRAERDEKAPRLLVIRVGEGWYARPVAARKVDAAAWSEHWRANVPQGIVAVLDARTSTPVVQFRRGEVVQITPSAPAP